MGEYKKMTAPKEVWNYLEQIIREAEDKKLTNEEVLQIIGLLKIAQTSLMLRMDSHKYPFVVEELEEKK